MDWFKHSIGSHDDPDISEAMDKFGHAGYSVFFILLEIYGTEFNRINGDGELSLKWKYFGQKSRTKRKCSENILTFYRECNRIDFQSFPESFTVSIPKFLEFASNYTRYEKPKYLNRHLNTTDKNQSVEVEVEEEKNIKAQKPKNPTPPSKEEEMILTELKDITNKLYKQKIFSNVYAFLNKALKERKNIKAIIHTLKQCLLLKPKEPWGYCTNILKVENGNFSEYEHVQKGKKNNSIFFDIIEKLKLAEAKQ